MSDRTADNATYLRERLHWDRGALLKSLLRAWSDLSPQELGAAIDALHQEPVQAPEPTDHHDGITR
jgi:hypothetical protein